MTEAQLASQIEHEKELHELKRAHAEEVSALMHSWLLYSVPTHGCGFRAGNLQGLARQAQMCLRGLQGGNYFACWIWNR